MQGTNKKGSIWSCRIGTMANIDPCCDKMWQKVCKWQDGLAWTFFMLLGQESITIATGFFFLFILFMVNPSNRPLLGKQSIQNRVWLKECLYSKKIKQVHLEVLNDFFWSTSKMKYDVWKREEFHFCFQNAIFYLLHCEWYFFLEMFFRFFSLGYWFCFFKENTAVK